MTGLGNRKCFDDFIDEHSDIEANHGNIAVVFIDLNGLKHINDTRGHDAGDQTLVDVARFLEESFRDEDVKMHLSGDEFVIFCNNVGHGQSPTSDDQRHSNGEFTDGLKKRLQEKVFTNLPKELELAWDVAVCDKDQDKDLKDTVKRADLGMQVKKQEMKDAKLNWMQRLLRKLSVQHLPPR